ncbi:MULTISPECIES: DUF4276 family protein [unclassified Nodularia (in: cyanobacteria)]|uniref:DUF4276 family protein n=1 Tax=unclassified Nodularia (in: cyanobacteria) TaxID=2656917 RepID=UPI00187EB206|nr:MULTISPECIES: DUF4276 family protein [unclassified Nodularia (in: cyanobacteria)]MBE9200315.1 DUF4276 family protein [Nodularia sp. LEGE 06071]MCC2694216.1 DUF4276 family protein [Nodularia sp. LEGE 04288]
MHIEFLVEELSMKEALQNLLPKILGETISFDIHPYQGKKYLLAKLPHRLRGYKSWLPDEDRIVILVDEDREDCKLLKERLENIAIDAGFITKAKASVGIGQNFQVLNRIAIEELEAWFFGDIDALINAYPGISPNLEKQAKYRDPDLIMGGTWEALEKVLQRAGYHKGGLEKTRAAREISQYMNPSINSSNSFQIFYDGLLKTIHN